MQLPADHNAEQAILSCAIQSDSALVELMAKIRIEHFDFPANGMIWDCLCSMKLDKKPIDIISIYSEMSAKGNADEVGGAAKISEIGMLVGSASNHQYYFDILEDRLKRRKMITAAANLMNSAQDMGIPIVDAQEAAGAAILSLATSASGTRHIREILAESADRWEIAFKSKGENLRGIQVGIPSWDKATLGLKPETFHIIGAPTKGGKSALALQMATFASVQNGHPCAIFSLEMSEQECADRLTFGEARIPMEDFLSGTMTQDNVRKFHPALGRLMRSPIYVRDESFMTALQFRAAARQLVQKYGFMTILLDYAQLVEPSDSKKMREQQIAEISRQCKLTAKELKVPIIALTQLNDDGRSRESRALENDCDTFTVIEADPQEDKEESDRDPWKCWLNIKLNRSGPNPRIPVRFLKNIGRFEETFNH